MCDCRVHVPGGVVEWWNDDDHHGASDDHHGATDDDDHLYGAAADHHGAPDHYDHHHPSADIERWPVSFGRDDPSDPGIELRLSPVVRGPDPVGGTARPVGWPVCNLSAGRMGSAILFNAPGV